MLPISQFLFELNAFWGYISTKKANFDKIKKTHPRKFYALSNKAIFIEIGSQMAKLILTDGFGAKKQYISVTLRCSAKMVAPLERAHRVG